MYPLPHVKVLSGYSLTLDPNSALVLGYPLAGFFPRLEFAVSVWRGEGGREGGRRERGGRDEVRGRRGREGGREERKGREGGGGREGREG